MKRIPIEIILQAWKEHNKQSTTEMFASQRYLFFVQPFLMHSMMLSDDDEGAINLIEKQTQYHLGCFMLHLMMKENPALNQVKEADMDAAYKRICAEKGFKLVQEDPCAFLKWLDHMLSCHNQRDLLTFIWQYLVSLNSKNSKEMRAQSTFLIFTFLRIILETLDAVQLAYN